MIRVLIIDDNEADFILIQRLLAMKPSSSGALYECEHAHSYESGIDMIQNRKYDVALLDYRLGPRSGLELLKAVQGKSRLPIILLTGLDDHEIDLAASEAGAADYLSKSDLDRTHLERSIRYAMTHARTLQALRESQKKLELFMKYVPCAVCIKDEEGRYVYVNEAGSEMLQCEEQECIGKTAMEIWPQENTTILTGSENEILKSKKPVRSIEAIPGSSHRLWLTSKFPIFSAEGPALLGIAAIDISELVAAEEELERTKQMLDGVLSHLPVMVGSVDKKGIVTELHGTGLTRIGITHKQLIGHSLAEIYPSIQKHLASALEGGSKNFVWDIEHESKVHYFDSYMFFDSRQGEGAIFFGLNISERKSLEKMLLKQNEEAQRRIGRDLHDGLGQYLTGIACLTSALEEKLSLQGIPEAQDAKKIAKLVQETISQTRGLARGLCPIQVEKAGLETALQDLAFNIQQVHNISCRLEINQPHTIQDYSMGVHLYRIAQEAINNAIKHAQPRQITIRLSSSKDQNVLSIQDDGHGFSPAEQRDISLGLQLMNYRAALIGGALKIQSKVNQGTTVECAFSNKTLK